MKKTTKRWLILATGVLCVGALTAAAACSTGVPTQPEEPVGATGTVLFLEEGEPDRQLGTGGDVCFVASTGTVYRKVGTKWRETAFEAYSVEGEMLNVTYSDGTVGIYEIAAPQANDGAATACEHTDFSELVTIYPAFCVVPGIGVKTCDACHESFVEIIPADPEKHDIDASNFGKCSMCGKLEDGTSGFVVDSSNVENIGAVVEQLQDGDTLHIGGNKEGGDPGTSEAVQFTAEHSLDIGENKNVTVDVKDVDVTFTSGASSALSVGAGSSVTFKSEEGGTEAPTINLNSYSSKPAVSVNGNGAVLNVEGMKINVQNEHKTTDPTGSTNFPSAIVVQNGGEANIGGNTVIEVYGQTENPVAYKEPHAAKVTGKGSVLNIENTTVNTHNATAFYAENEGELHFNSGEINVEGGSSCAALSLGSGAGKIVFSGGTINIKGEIKGTHAHGLGNFAAAIGSTEEQCGGAEVIVNGGTINLAPTSGIAIAILGVGDIPRSSAYVGDGVVINMNATGSGKAYVGVNDYSKAFCIYIYGDTVIKGEIDGVHNFRKPDEPLDPNEYYEGGLVDFRKYDQEVKLIDEHPEYCKENI